MKNWYQIYGERKKLSPQEAALYTGAVQITCPDCVHELETGRPVPAGVVHDCDYQGDVYILRRLGK